jgi:hypothetical protein
LQKGARHTKRINILKEAANIGVKDVFNASLLIG